MNYKFLLLFIIGFFIFTSDVSAGMCDSEHISQLKELANQVDISYEYLDHSDESDGEGDFVTNTYLVSVNLISDELYLEYYGKKYYFNQNSDGLVTFVANSGNISLSFHSKSCLGYKLKSETIQLPRFNTYSYRMECETLKEYNLNVCDPWYQGEVTDDIFNSAVEKYLKNDFFEVKPSNKLILFIKEYYLYIVGIIFLVMLLVISIINFKKRSVLE